MSAPLRDAPIDDLFGQVADLLTDKPQKVPGADRDDPLRRYQERIWMMSKAFSPAATALEHSLADSKRPRKDNHHDVLTMPHPKTTMMCASPRHPETWYVHIDNENSVSTRLQASEPRACKGRTRRTLSSRHLWSGRRAVFSIAASERAVVAQAVNPAREDSGTRDEPS